MAEQQHLPHNLTLNDRKKLTLTGISEVISFDDNSVIMHTPLGTLIVQGSGLQLKTLTTEGGNVAVEGEIIAISYEQSRAGGWLGRFFS